MEKDDSFGGFETVYVVEGEFMGFETKQKMKWKLKIFAFFFLLFRNKIESDI